MLVKCNLPMGKVSIVATAEAAEQTSGVTPLIHEVIVKSYASPGERFGTVHSDRVDSQDIGVPGAPVPVTATEYES